MSKATDTANTSMRTPGAALALPPALDWAARIVFGLAMAGIAAWSTYTGGLLFAAMIAVVTVAGAREWHRMIDRPSHIRTFTVTALALVAMILALTATKGALLPWFLLAVGVAANTLIALSLRVSPIWEGGGVLYVGLAAFAMIALRMIGTDGVWLILALFITVWASDTGALICGKLIGGAKLLPAVSPNKTWAGFIGGLVFGAGFAAIVFALLHRDIATGIGFGLAISLAGIAGDLFESWAKRKFDRKNSGALIPGHGGVLDRIDSTLFAAPALAAFVLLLHIDPLAGAHP